MYIVFEGIDTVGKSTQITNVSQKFSDVLITKEPGGTPFGLKIRDILLHGEELNWRTELFLFLADRAEHYEQIIKPNLHRTILSDRSFLSGMAYAMANATLEESWLLQLNYFTLQETLPDLLILFSIDEQTLRSRLSGKSNDTIEQRGISYMLEVQKHLLTIASHLNIPTLTIDATEPIETIETKIYNYIKEYQA
jgi:dTMP kinase